MTKRRTLERELLADGWSKTEGANHTKFRKGRNTVIVPRHNEIKDQLADAIRRQAGLR